MVRKTVILFSLAIPNISFCQQIEYEIHGKIERITNSNNIILTTGISSARVDTVQINDEGMFSFRGSLAQAQEARLGIDSSSMAFFWIDSGLISMQVKEVKYNGEWNFLDIVSLRGPADSYLYFYKRDLSKRMNFAVVPVIIDTKKFIEANPRFANSMIVRSREEGIEKRDSITYHFIDSVFRVRPDSKVLPHYIRFYSSEIGPAKTGSLYNRLSPDLQNSEDGKGIIEYLSQQSALKPGSTLENFSMNDSNGKLFKLKDVKAEFILLDFWASWCGPCRANHPFLREAAEKYKDKGLKIISVSLDDNKTEWLDGIEKDKLSWTNITDLKGFEGLLAKRCKIYSIPFTLLLDKNRKIVDLNLSGSELLWTLESIISNK